MALGLSYSAGDPLPAADMNSIVGAIDTNTGFVSAVTATASEINQALDGISVNVTDTNLNTLTAGIGTPITTLHAHKRTFGSQSSSINSSGSSPTAVNIAHSLGVTPNWVKIKAIMRTLGQSPTDHIEIESIGESNGSNHYCVYSGSYADGGQEETTQGHNTSNIIYLPYYDSGNSRSLASAATLTSTQIQLSVANTGSSSKTIYILWECGV